MPKLSIAICIVISFWLYGCSFFKNELPLPQFNRGVLILQTKNISSNTHPSYLSYLDTMNSLTQNIFLMLNKNSLGNGASTMSLYNGRGYVMLTEEDKIAVLNGVTLEKIGTIGGELEKNLVGCRYFASVNENKAYVTCWGNSSIPSSISVIDLNSLQILKNIDLGMGKNPEAIIIKGNYAYVALSGDNSIAVINTDQDVESSKRITVGQPPIGIVVDRFRKIWVLSNAPDYKLSVIDSISIISSVNIKTPEKDSYLNNLCINSTGDILYFNTSTISKPTLDSIYSFPIGSTIFNPKIKNGITKQEVVIMKIDPYKNILYASTKTGSIYRYTLPTTNITATVSKKDTLSVITTPVDFVFQPRIK